MGYLSTLVFWEAVYDDGSVVREADGNRYVDLDRNRLTRLRLTAPGEILAEIGVGDGRSGWNIVYRRRTIAQGGKREAWFVLGFMPMGPWLAVQPEQAIFRQAEHLHQGAGPLGMVQPVDGEHWKPNHATDARLTPQQVVLPGGYAMRGS